MERTHRDRAAACGAIPRGGARHRQQVLNMVAFCCVQRTHCIGTAAFGAVPRGDVLQRPLRTHVCVPPDVCPYRTEELMKGQEAPHSLLIRAHAMVRATFEDYNHYLRPVFIYCERFTTLPSPEKLFINGIRVISADEVHVVMANFFTDHNNSQTRVEWKVTVDTRFGARESSSLVRVTPFGSHNSNCFLRCFHDSRVRWGAYVDELQNA